MGWFRFEHGNPRPRESERVIILGMCALLDDQSVVLEREPEKEKSLYPSGPRIRCPLCGWSPRENDYWSCSCGHEWNTFDTGGVCPACTLQWTETQCLSCKGWSPHSEWYAQ